MTQEVVVLPQRQQRNRRNNRNRVQNVRPVYRRVRGRGRNRNRRRNRQPPKSRMGAIRGFKGFNPSTNLNSNARHFAEAVVNPFSNAAIGALVPDRWTPPSISGMDRLSLTLDPVIWMAKDNKLESITGWLVCLVPRSLAAGWKTYVGDTTQWLKAVVPLNIDFTEPSHDPRLDLYALFVAAIGVYDGGETRLNCYDPETNKYREGVNVIPFARHEILEATASGGRIVGAGLKLHANAPPLTTGGVVYGGWMPIVDLAAQIPVGKTDSAMPPLVKITSRLKNLMAEEMKNDGFDDLSDIEDLGRTAKIHRLLRTVRVHRSKYGATATRFGDINAANIQDLIRYRKSFVGTDGCTIRYSPLQSPVQEEFRQMFDNALATGNDVDGARTNRGQGGGASDAISISDYIPSAVWLYNSVANDVQAYTLRIESRVHLQCEPDSNNPYMAVGVMPDPSYNHLQMILQNKDVYPVVTEGHSFKSFMKGVDRAMDTMLNMASKIPLLKLAAGF